MKKFKKILSLALACLTAMTSICSAQNICSKTEESVYTLSETINAIIVETPCSKNNENTKWLTKNVNSITVNNQSVNINYQIYENNYSDYKTDINTDASLKQAVSNSQIVIIKLPKHQTSGDFYNQKKANTNWQHSTYLWNLILNIKKENSNIPIITVGFEDCDEESIKLIKQLQASISGTIHEDYLVSHAFKYMPVIHITNKNAVYSKEIENALITCLFPERIPKNKPSQGGIITTTSIGITALGASIYALCKSIKSKNSKTNFKHILNAKTQKNRLGNK